MDNLIFWKICRIINLILDKIVKIDMDINSAEIIRILEDWNLWKRDIEAGFLGKSSL